MTTFLEQQIETMRAHLEKLERRLQMQEEQDTFIPSIYVAKTGAGGIAALSGNTPGSGTVTLHRKDGNGDLAALTDGTGADITKTAYNLASTSVAGSTWVQLKQEITSGMLLVDFEDCG